MTILDPEQDFQAKKRALLKRLGEAKASNKEIRDQIARLKKIQKSKDKTIEKLKYKKGIIGPI